MAGGYVFRKIVESDSEDDSPPAPRPQPQPRLRPRPRPQPYTPPPPVRITLKLQNLNEMGFRQTTITLPISFDPFKSAIEKKLDRVDLDLTYTDAQGERSALGDNEDLELALNTARNNGNILYVQYTDKYD